MKNKIVSFLFVFSLYLIGCQSLENDQSKTPLSVKDDTLASTIQPTKDIPEEIPPEEKYFLIFEDDINKDSPPPSNQINIPGFYFDLVWSPQGNHLALIGEIEIEPVTNMAANIFLLDINNQILTPITDFGYSGISDLNWIGEEYTFSFLNYAIFSGRKTYILSIDPTTDILYTINDLQEIDRLAGFEVNLGSWTKDGKEVVYIRENLIFKLNIETDMEIQLLDTEAIYSEVSISNNGEWIAYIISDNYRYCISYCQQDIFLLNLQNHETFQLTNNEYGFSDFKWAPNDQYLMFLSNRFDPAYLDCDSLCKTDIFIARLGNPTVVSLTSDEYDNYSPTWSPDGNQIAFISNRSGNLEVYIMGVSNILP